MLRTNTKITPLQVMLRYRDLLRVEQLLRQAKAVLATRPIYHSRRAPILTCLASSSVCSPEARGTTSGTNGV